MARNPWPRLPTNGRKVLAEDRPFVEAFNATQEQYRDGDRFRLHLDPMPEPFLGNPRTARVVLLQLNPGFIPADCDAHGDWRFRQAARRNLAHAADPPMFLLDPRFAATPGGRWWRGTINRLSRAVMECLGCSEGDARHHVAQRLLVVEFHGYHSNRFRPIPVTLPSQQYGFHLVQRAIERNLIVIVARGVRLWTIAIPALRSHRRTIVLPTARRIHLTEKSLGPTHHGQDWFPVLVRELAS